MEDIKAIIERLEKHLDERFDKLERKIDVTSDKTDCNRMDVVRMQERLNNGSTAFDRNDKQHEEFYSSIKSLKEENDIVSGGLKVIQVVIMITSTLIVGIIIAIIRSYL